MSVTIYHNPRCSKSRQTMQLLEEQNIQPDVVEYLNTPPNAETLDSVLNLLGMEPRDLMRKKEAEYQALNLDDESLSHEQLIAAMVANPKLIERPIVISGTGNNRKAAIGRPPESVLNIL